MARRVKAKAQPREPMEPEAEPRAAAKAKAVPKARAAPKARIEPTPVPEPDAEPLNMTASLPPLGEKTLMEKKRDVAQIFVLLMKEFEVMDVQKPRGMHRSDWNTYQALVGAVLELKGVGPASTHWTSEETLQKIAWTHHLHSIAARCIMHEGTGRRYEQFMKLYAIHTPLVERLYGLHEQ